MLLVIGNGNFRDSKLAKVLRISTLLVLTINETSIVSSENIWKGNRQGAVHDIAIAFLNSQHCGVSMKKKVSRSIFITLHKTQVPVDQRF